MKFLIGPIATLYKSDTSVSKMWEISDSLSTSIKTHIPHRLSESEDKLPWIGLELKKKLIRKQHRAYKTKKKTGDPCYIQRYMAIKHQVQKRTRKAYCDYIEEIVTPGPQENQYAGMIRFWTHVKLKRKDNGGVSPLK